MKKRYCLSLLLLTSCFLTPASAAPAGGKQISPDLIGIFFEDISSSADGGLYAEQVQNGSFEYSPNEREGWGPATSWRMVRPGHSTGYIEPRTDSPLNDRNPHYMRIVVERAKHYYDYKGHCGVGIRNNGFDGIRLVKGAQYHFSAFLRTAGTMPVSVRLYGPKDTLAATATLTAAGAWQKYEATITADCDIEAANLEVLAEAEGALDIDMVSLMPADTYKGHGMRRDLAQALADLQPKFIRFPGGCVVHGGGDGLWATYLWKNTVGPKEQRIPTKNPWGYHQSMGLGYYEYFQFCEDIHADALPILPVGVSCQGAGGGWGMKGQAQTAVPMSDMQRWADDALDLIEWANGPATSKWGAVRAAAGHPEPFNMKYIGLGNEEKISPEFEERFKFIYKQVKARYPDIIVVGTAGPGSHKGNPDYDNGWRIAEQTGLDIIDEHYYEKRDYFINNQANYDSYPRDRKTKVYLGEYAAKDKTMADALAEALYLTGVERNGDVVSMTSYAPLFAKKGHTNWNPDLIYFDNARPYLTASYYVQQMFGTTAGDYYYAGRATMGKQDKMLATSTVYNSKRHEVYFKYVNATAEPQQVKADLKGFKILDKQATVTTLAAPTAETKNDYDQQPIAPAQSKVKAATTITLTVPPFSCTAVAVKAK